MYVIFETGGKQYRAEPGDVLYVEKLPAEAEDTVLFERVFAIGGEGTFRAGTPLVEGASVTATVLKNGKGKKIRVFTYRAKKGSKRALGHRQPYTKIQIDQING